MRQPARIRVDAAVVAVAALACLAPQLLGGALVTLALPIAAGAMLTLAYVAWTTRGAPPATVSTLVVLVPLVWTAPNVSNWRCRLPAGRVIFGAQASLDECQTQQESVARRLGTNRADSMHHLHHTGG